MKELLEQTMGVNELSMKVADMSDWDMAKAIKSIESEVGPLDVIEHALLTLKVGSSNKFHFFVIGRKQDATFVGANSYGRIGYQPKVNVFAEGDRQTVKNAYDKKIDAKFKKGYEYGERPHRDVPYEEDYMNRESGESGPGDM